MYKKSWSADYRDVIPPIEKAHGILTSICRYSAIAKCSWSNENWVEQHESLFENRLMRACCGLAAVFVKKSLCSKLALIFPVWNPRRSGLLTPLIFYFTRVVYLWTNISIGEQIFISIGRLCLRENQSTGRLSMCWTFIKWVSISSHYYENNSGSMQIRPLRSPPCSPFSRFTVIATVWPRSPSFSCSSVLVCWLPLSIFKRKQNLNSSLLILMSHANIFFSPDLGSIVTVSTDKMDVKEWAGQSKETAPGKKLNQQVY